MRDDWRESTAGVMSVPALLWLLGWQFACKEDTLLATRAKSRSCGKSLPISNRTLPSLQLGYLVNLEAKYLRVVNLRLGSSARRADIPNAHRRIASFPLHLAIRAPRPRNSRRG